MGIEIQRNHTIASTHSESKSVCIIQRTGLLTLCDMSTFPILHRAVGTIGREINRFGGFIIRRSQEAPSRFKYHDREGHGAGDVCRPELYLRTYYFEIRRAGTYLVSNFGSGRSGCSSGRGAGIASKLPGLDQTWLWDGFDGTLVLNQG